MQLKYLCILINLLAFILLPNVAFSEGVKISDENAPFLYESRAEIKTPDNKLAEYLSKDYRNARDEFTKHDLMKQIKPVIEKRMLEAKNTPNVFLLIGGKLGDFDFASNAFPTGFGETSFIPFKNGYAVTFTNGDQIEMLPVSVDHARTLSETLRKGRQANYSVFGEIVGVKETKINWNTNKAIEVKITGVEVKLRSGQKVGSISF